MKALYSLLLFLLFLDFSGADSRICNENRPSHEPIPEWIIPDVVERIDEILPNDDDDDLIWKIEDESTVKVISSSKVSASQRTRLPSMLSGGLIFFLHIPKTGGTTIRLNLRKFDDRVRYIFANNRTMYEDTAPIVEDIILNGTKGNEIVVYEVHASTSPSFYGLRNLLQRWKETAARNNVPTFFFTVVREPVSFAFSHFSFFHLEKRNQLFERCNATEEDFLRLSLYNPQCHFLFKGEVALRWQKVTKRKAVIKPNEYLKVRNSMLRIFDWVGSTEKHSNETLPLLSRLLDLPTNFTWQNHRVSSEVTYIERFGPENVTSSALETIHDLSTMDMELYRTAVNRYRYEKMIFK